MPGWWEEFWLGVGVGTGGSSFHTDPLAQSRGREEPHIVEKPVPFSFLTWTFSGSQWPVLPQELLGCCLPEAHGLAWLVFAGRVRVPVDSILLGQTSCILVHHLSLVLPMGLVHEQCSVKMEMSGGWPH